jgi:adenylyltransferase/sulfurtransferase
LDAIKQRLAEAASPSSNGASSAAEEQPGQPQPPLYVVCRRGNDSQRAVAALRAAGVVHAVDVVGGMEAWAAEVDPGFPTY